MINIDNFVKKSIVIVFLILNFPFMVQAQLIRWTQRYDGGNMDYACGIAIDTSGNVYVTGRKNNGSNYDYFTIKYDSAGNTIWTQQYDSGSSDYGNGIAVDSSDNVYVTGRKQAGFNQDYFTIKYDSSGNTIWTQRYDGGGNDYAHAIAVDTSHNVYVTGYKPGNVNFDCFTIKYDSIGNTIWTQGYDGGFGEDRGNGIAVDTGGNVYVTGDMNPGGLDDCFTIKYDSAGNTIWTQYYDGGSWDVGQGVAVDTSGNVYVTGIKDNGGNNDCFIIKYDSSGNTIWTRQHGGPGDDRGNGIAVDTSGNIYVTGNKSDGGNLDYFTIKYDSEGNTVWTQQYNGLNFDMGQGIAVDTSDNVYVTGDNNNDYFTIKYIQDPKIYYSTVISFEPSKGKFFKKNGIINGNTVLEENKGYTLDYTEIRIKNNQTQKYWNGHSWSTSTNNWLRVEGGNYWKYSCKGINWDYGSLHYVDSRSFTLFGFQSDISEKVEFIPVYYLPENSFISYPNPFDPNEQTTTIEYLLMKDEETKLIIYDISGHIVYDWTFYPGHEGAKHGMNRITWNGKNKQGHIVSNGIYFAYLKKGDNHKMTKIMVVK